MNTKTKGTKAAHHGPKQGGETPESALNEFRTLLHRNLERLVGLQKQTLDTLSRQTEDVAETVRNSATLKSTLGDLTAIDLARDNMQTWINSQKKALDAVVQRSAKAAEASNQLSSSLSESISVLTELFHKTAERTLDAQKTMLEFAATQNKAVSDAVYRQSRSAGIPETDVTELMQRGIVAWIDTQKEFLEQATKIGKAAANLKF